MSAAEVDPGQRLSATMVLSLLVHALLVFGITFTLADPAPVMPTLDVILTEVSTELSPEQADFLAQASNQGGGEHETTARPSDDQIGLAPRESPGDTVVPTVAQSADEPPPQTRVVSSRHGEQRVLEPENSRIPDPTPVSHERDQLQRDMEMARLSAEIQQRSERYARRPTRKFVSASTREHAYAAYMRAWVDRAVRVGNLNYPDEARRRRLAGEVVISVAVRRDGSVEDIQIVRTSGIRLLDDAAIRIARLAEPYPPLPATDDNVDVLHITRTWQFLPGGSIVDE